MNLSGKLLIAMPGMGDPRFDHSVVFVCAHSDDGAMGLIVNKPASEITFPKLLRQLQIPVSDRMRDIRIHMGGPVELTRGFVLHSGDYDSSATTLRINSLFGMTTTLDILECLASGAGPESAVLALGYAGWGPGQLETEIAQNGWLTAEAAPDLVFSMRSESKWGAALKTLGIEPMMLSSTAGRA
jgi:putative transcriptional regulator